MLGRKRWSTTVTGLVLYEYDETPKHNISD
jgi:hypothetical protein